MCKFKEIISLNYVYSVVNLYSNLRSFLLSKRVSIYFFSVLLRTPPDLLKEIVIVDDSREDGKLGMS